MVLYADFSSALFVIAFKMGNKNILVLFSIFVKHLSLILPLFHFFWATVSLLEMFIC